MNMKKYEHLSSTKLMRKLSLCAVFSQSKPF
jgi:hypothetical protein